MFSILKWNQKGQDAFSVLAFFLLLIIVLWLCVISRSVTPISDVQLLNPKSLPFYASCTLFRMFIALLFSTIVSIILGTWAAKYKYAGYILIPMIDVLQSVPVLAFFSLTFVVFVNAFGASGFEYLCIFLIFTAQVWNMALSVYTSFRSIPDYFYEVASHFKLSTWKVFWTIELPFAIPDLIWNAMVSMSASWFSLVASEAISVGDQMIYLPGIGSYISFAIRHSDSHAMLWAMGMMLVAIACYDQCFFRPLLAWSQRFYMDSPTSQVSSWMLNGLRYFHRIFSRGVGNECSVFLNFLADRSRPARYEIAKIFVFMWPIFRFFIWFMIGFWIIYMLGSLWGKKNHVIHIFTWNEWAYLIHLSFLTAKRVLLALVLCTFVWVPIGIWIGTHEKAVKFLQPMIQFMASIPGNLFFPWIVAWVVKDYWSQETGCVILMLLSAQWYLLFNIISGMRSISEELTQLFQNMHCSPWMKLRYLIIPFIFPSWIRGMVTGAGGAWNASLIAEVMRWGDQTLTTQGIGSYIFLHAGDMTSTAASVIVMSCMIVLINYTLWRPLQAYAKRRYTYE